MRLQLSIFLDIFGIHCLQNRQLLLVFEQFLDLLGRDAIFDGRLELVECRILLAYVCEHCFGTSTLFFVVNGKWNFLAWTVEVATLRHPGPWGVLASSSVPALRFQVLLQFALLLLLETVKEHVHDFPRSARTSHIDGEPVHDTLDELVSSSVEKHSANVSIFVVGRPMERGHYCVLRGMVWARACRGTIFVALHQGSNNIESWLLSEIPVTLGVVAPEAGAHERGETDGVLLVEQFMPHVTTVLNYPFNKEINDIVVAIVRSEM